jgi:polyhydroxyalkanoic acid synthase PhaR subunit
MSQTDASQKQSSFDPFELWRQVYESNEQAWSKAIRDMATTQDYAEAQGKVLESMLALQKMMRDGMSAQLNSLNVPTRDDVSRLGELVLSLEEKIDQIDDHFPALERRIAELDKKVDGLVDLGKKDRLSDLSQKIEKLAGIEKKVDQIAELEKKIDAVDRRLAALAERATIQPPEEVPAPGAEPERPARAPAGRGRAAGKTE